MPWPKGMPRKGHVNKDGTPHAKHGAKKATAVDRPVITMRKISADMVPAENPNHPTLHGATFNTSGRPSTAITEPCPQCAYAYADGGYCPDCGWSKPIVRVPYGTASGRKSWK